MSRTGLFLIALLLLALLAPACQRTPSGAANGTPVVVASTTMLHDLVRQLGGTDVQAECIMTPGTDPHLYQPRPSDAALVGRSQLVVRNGLGLEGWIDDLLANAGGERPTVTATTGVTPLEHDGTPDPHFWFDVEAWAVAAENVHVGLLGAREWDAATRERLAARHQAYQAHLEALHAWVEAQWAQVPETRRVLVTSHDAFAYHGAAYGVQVVSVQGVSTVQEASPRDVIGVVEAVRQRSIPMVFGETSVNGGLIEQVAREAGVPVGGPLYSDSLGAPDSPAATYTGMMVENVCMIVTGLGAPCDRASVPALPSEGSAQP